MIQRLLNRQPLLVTLAVVALSGGIRWYVAERTFPLTLVGDEHYYVRVATNIATGHGALFDLNSRAFRPPAHPYLLSFFADRDRPRTPDRTQTVLHRLILLQVVLGTLLVGLTTLLGCALFDVRTGLLAGLIAALFPTFIAFSHYLWSENLFAVLITGALLCVVRTHRSYNWFLGVTAGLLFGLGTLTRETALAIGGAAALWWVWTAPTGKRRLALTHSAVMLGLAVLVVLPWSYRNYALFGRIIPVSTIGWYAFGEGNALEGSNWLKAWGPQRTQFKKQYFAIRDEMERVNFAQQYARDKIAAEQPTWLLKKLVRELALLWSPDSFLFYKLHLGSYGKPSLSVVRPLILVTIGLYILVVVLGALGVAIAKENGRSLLLGLVLVVFSTLHVLTVANSRYRVPLMPLLIVYASYGALYWHECRARLAGWRWVAPVAALLFFFGVCVPYYYVYGYYG